MNLAAAEVVIDSSASSCCGTPSAATPGSAFSAPAISTRRSSCDVLPHEFLKTHFLILPSLILVFVFRYLPIYGVTLAFRFYDPGRGVFGSPWAQPITYNFWFLQDPEFWRVLMNTLRITSAKIIFGFPAPIILAILLNELRGQAYKRVAQTIT